MTPKEKAKELFDKYQIAGSQWYVDTTKKYALIAVDEIMNQYVPIPVSHFVTSYKSADDFNDNFLNIERQIKDFTAYRILYWKQVKNEIEKL